MSNKSRKEARAVVQLVARYRSPTVFTFVEESCYDISRGGMFIGSSSPASVGTLLKLECDQDDGEDKLKAVARVVWTRSEANEMGPTGMGVKFVKIEPGGDEVLERILNGRASLIDGGEQLRGSIVPRPPVSERPAASSPPIDHAAHAASIPSSDANEIAEPVAALQTAADSPVASESNARESSSTSDAPDLSQPSSPRASEPVAAAARRNSERPVTAPPSSRPPLGKTSSDWTMGLIVAGVLLVAVVFQSMRSSDSSKSAEAPAAVPETTAAAADEDNEPAVATKPMPEPAAPVAEQAPAAAASPQEVAAEEAQPQAAAANEAPATPNANPEAEQQPEAAPVAAPEQPAAVAAPAATAGSYVVSVITRPSGARVTLRGKELYAPGDFDFADFPETVRIEAEKFGFKSTAGTVDPKDFEADGEVMRRRIYLKLKPEE